MPGPVKPHRPYTAHSNSPSSVTAVHAGHKRGGITEEVDRRKVKPQPGAPIEHSSISEKRGIIFVGGKKASGAPATASGHAALNPQPIPPGHATFDSPHPRVPIERAGH